MTDSFFPSENYEIPSAPSNYYKFEDGENTFRVMSSAIIGYEYWTTDNKPVRSRTAFDHIPQDIRTNKDGTPSRIKHFWAFVVWDYREGAIKVLEVTRRTVMDGIKTLVDNPKWGNPKEYDITVTRTGEGFDTTYTVMPNPHSEITPEMSTAYAAKPVNLEALYEAKDPFEVNEKTF